jgi:hypothetical protein
MPDETNSSFNLANGSSLPTIYSADYAGKDLAMKRPSQLRELSTGVSLLVLALGFSSLGFLSLFKRYSDNAEEVLFSESTYSFIGSFLSLLVGATFLVTALVFLETKLRGKAKLIPDGFSKAPLGRCKNLQPGGPAVIDRPYHYGHR